MLTCSSWVYGAAYGQFHYGYDEAEPVLFFIVQVFCVGSELDVLRHSRAGAESGAQVLVFC